MAFWKKGKKRAIQRPQPEEQVPQEPHETPREIFRSASNIYAEIVEDETGVFEGNKIKITSEKRVLRITNNGPDPAFNITVTLKNTGSTDLPKKIDIPSLGTAPNENVHETEYRSKNYSPPLKITYDLVFPQQDQDFLYADEDNNIEILFKLDPSLPTNQNKIELKYEPSEFIGNVGITLQEKENVGTNEKIEWRIPVTINPRVTEPIPLGSAEIRVEINGAGLTGVEIDKVLSKAIVQPSASKRLVPGEKDKWSVIITLSNPNSYPVTVSGSITFLNANIVSVSDNRLQQKQAKLTFDSLEIEAGSSIELGEILVESIDEPKIKVDVKGYNEGESSAKGSGIYTVELVELPVVAVDITKTVNVHLDSGYSPEDLGENALPTRGDNYLEVTTEVTNTGSVDLEKVEIIEQIPAGFSAPEKVEVLVDGNPLTTFDSSLDPQDIDADRTFTVTVVPPSKLGGNSTVVLKYILRPEKFLEDRSVILGSATKAYPKQDVRPLEKPLPESEAPMIKVLYIEPNIHVSVTPNPTSEKDVFNVVINVENRGQYPIIDYTIEYVVPSSFEILEISPEPSDKKQLKSGVKLLWTLKLDPNTPIQANIKVRGKPGYSVDELSQGTIL